MRHEVKLPELGEDANDTASVGFWMVDTGSYVNEGDELLELTTDKAAFSVPSPASGVLTEKCVDDGDEVSVGDLLCVLDE